jgi:apolipoprotein N-acyltransferase
VARAATTGVSALIAPDGRALARVADAQGRALDAVGYAVHELPLAGSATPYLRFGDWIVGVEGAILGAAFWAARRRAGAA